MRRAMRSQAAHHRHTQKGGVVAATTPPLISLTGTGFSWSGRPDLNGRPLEPHSSALPGCATDCWGFRPRTASVQHHQRGHGGGPMARRNPGEGSITQRPNGLWQGALQVDGRRRTVYGHSKAEVRVKLAALREQAGTLGALPERHTVGDLLSQWLVTGEPRWAPSTLHDYRYYVGIIEASIPARTPLDRLALERLQALLLAHQATPRTAQLLYHVLHTACSLGVRWGWLPAYPADRLVRPASRKRARDWWTVEQCETFLSGTETSRWW